MAHPPTEARLMSWPFNSCIFVPGLTSSECAAWVQAWGSILAIVAAGWIARIQLRAARAADADRQRLERVEKYWAIRGILVHASACFELAARQARERDDNLAWERLGEEVAKVRSAILALPTFELPEPTLVLKLAKLDQDLRALATACQGNLEAETSDVLDNVATYAEAWNARAEEVHLWCAQRIEANSTIAELEAARRAGLLD